VDDVPAGGETDLSLELERRPGGNLADFAALARDVNLAAGHLQERGSITRADDQLFSTLDPTTRRLDLGNDLLGGGTGNDILIGGPGDDLLIGHRGRNILIGGDGSDRLIGHAGNGDNHRLGVDRDIRQPVDRCVGLDLTAL
jgi:Ca2+-binding RTX toxin-like protein